MVNIAGKEEANAQFGRHVENMTGEGKPINIAEKTGVETNAEAGRERNLALKNNMQAELERQKAMGLETGGQQQVQTGQQQQQQGQQMMAMAAVLGGLGALTFGASAMQAVAVGAAGAMLISLGQGNQQGGQQKIQQAPPIAQQAQGTQQVADGHDQRATELEVAEPIDDTGNDITGGGNGNTDGEDIDAEEGLTEGVVVAGAIPSEALDETNIGENGEFGDDGSVASGSVSEEAIELAENGELDQLADVSNEIAANASEEELQAYFDIFEGKNEEEIFGLSEEFMASDIAKADGGVSSEDYITKFLEFYDNYEGTEGTTSPGLEDGADIVVADATVDGSVEETNTISDNLSLVEEGITDLRTTNQDTAVNIRETVLGGEADLATTNNNPEVANG